MDIESFYHSQLRRWIFGSVGILVAAIGVWNIFFFFFPVHTAILHISVLNAMMFTLLGIGIILRAFNRKKEAFYLCLILIGALLVQSIFFFLIPNSALYSNLSKTLFNYEKGSLVHNALISGILFLLLTGNLLCHSVDSHKQRYLWISAILGGLGLGLSLYLVFFFITLVPYFQVGDANFTATTVSLMLLISLALIFFGRMRHAYYYPSTFIYWGATFVGLAALFLTAVAWLAFNDREKQSILNDNHQKAEIFDERVTEQGKTFFATLTRTKNRWEATPSIETKNAAFTDFNINNLTSSFPWAMDIGVASKERFFSVNPAEAKLAPFITQIIENNPSVAQLVKDKILVLFEKDPTSQTPLMLTLSPFNHPNFKEKAYFFSINNATEFLDSIIFDFFKKENGITVHSEEKILYQMNTSDTNYKSNFNSKFDLNFFGTPLALEIWPLIADVNASQSKRISWFLLAIGIIFSLTLAGCILGAEMAMSQKRAADKANREKTMFLANMSHELRTPLHGIVGSCSLLATTKLDEYQGKWVSAISKSSKILLDLVNDLLDLSKIEVNSKELDLYMMNLKHLLAEIIELTHPKVHSKKINLSFDYDPAMPENFVVDGKKIRQVVVNLIDNAIKYTPQGHVALKVTRAETPLQHFLVFCVEDSGVGISPEQLKHIYQKYLRIDVRSTQGSGLGLAIVKRLIDMMGGTIDISSEVGKGSIFTVKIPVTSPIKNKTE